ncbi:hypothetical protein BCR34DRAFT_108192 [Clohesyomyces aquaticus]|uniref:Uncharacterized protein n=1 Tax=Clohesyomyces aquaticus TaxID=1231657 RepID=A0A1Y1YRR9_9PLEO|nr:hypothetical protein BCR34DRAFT_108192 [Clohesyomyces aquaticus]
MSTEQPTLSDVPQVITISLANADGSGTARVLDQSEPLQAIEEEERELRKAALRQRIKKIGAKKEGFQKDLDALPEKSETEERVRQLEDQLAVSTHSVYTTLGFQALFPGMQSRLQPLAVILEHVNSVKASVQESCSSPANSETARPPSPSEAPRPAVKGLKALRDRTAPSIVVSREPRYHV